MALDAGDAIAGTGLAGAIAKARKQAWGKKYPLSKDAKAINLEAQAIIDYLIANTEVLVTDVTTGGDSAPGTIS